VQSHASKSNENILAYIKALEQAQRGLLSGKDDGLKSIRRIGRSLQRMSALTDPELLQIISHIQTATESEVNTDLERLLPRLSEHLSQNSPDKGVILLVEDNPLAARVIEKDLTSVLRRILPAASLKEAKAVLAKEDVAFVILDLGLPDGDGRDFLYHIRHNSNTTQIPVVVLSSQKEVEAKTECFALGADAYFEKPVNEAILNSFVAARLQRYADAARYSSIDTTTRLPNRSVFYNAYSRISRIAARTKEPVSVAILDLDRFKSVNDIAGHQMGDVVLQKVAALLLRTLRASDLVVRWGGEEFAVLFPNTNLGQARKALNKALETLRKQNFETQDGRVFKMTFSAGVTELRKGMTVEEAVADADRYLYLAKAAGRNHVLSKEDPLDKFQRNILLIEDDDFMASLLRRFLEKEGFRIFHARDGKTALALAAQATFSLITLDVKLPDLDGFELLKQFRRTPTTRHIPVIMLTSTAKEEDVVRGFQMGADDYIVKPFSPSQFMARVNRILEKEG